MSVLSPGVLRGLTRADYANAVRDFIEPPVDAATLLPVDDSVMVFDHIGSALSISPTLLHQRHARDRGRSTRSALH